MTNGREALPRLHVVTDDRVVVGESFLERAAEVLRAGGAGVALHLRHRGSGAALYRLAGTCAREAARHGAMFLVNGRVDVALATGADGVHLRRGAMPAGDAGRLLPDSARIGVSLHAVAEASGLAGGAADYAFLGPVFATATHAGAAELGLGALARAAKASPAPVLAIGGVDPSRIRACLDAGAHGVAVIRSVWAAERPGKAVETLLATMEARA